MSEKLKNQSDFKSTIIYKTDSEEIENEDSNDLVDLETSMDENEE